MSHRLLDGQSVSALDVQWAYFSAAKLWSEELDLRVVGGDQIGRDIMDRWEKVLTALENDMIRLLIRSTG